MHSTNSATLESSLSVQVMKSSHSAWENICKWKAGDLGITTFASLLHRELPDIQFLRKITSCVFPFG